MQEWKCEDDVADETVISVEARMGQARSSQQLCGKRPRSVSPETVRQGYEDTFTWGSRYLKRLRGLQTTKDFDAHSNFEKNLQKGIVLTTDYSGMGCAELAGKMLEVSAKLEGMSIGEGIACYRCSDIDEDPGEVVRRARNLF